VTYNFVFGNPFIDAFYHVSVQLLSEPDDAGTLNAGLALGAFRKLLFGYVLDPVIRIQKSKWLSGRRVFGSWTQGRTERIVKVVPLDPTTTLSGAFYIKQ
jgi:hypothetical protein